MFSKTAATFVEARAQYNHALAEFSEELNKQVEAHNTVVHNLAKKFNSELISYQEIVAKCKIVIDPANFSGMSNEYLSFTVPVQSSYSYGKAQTTRQLIPVAILRNDPIASAMYVRSQIRALQNQKRTDELKKIEAELKKARQAKTTAANNEQRIAERVELYRKQLGLTKIN